MLRQLILIIPILFFSKMSWSEANISEGRDKSATCVACHGTNGISVNPLWPNLAGQHQAYLLKQLKDFKTGVRKDPIMGAMVQVFSEKDMENISAYFESLGAESNK